eukprot:GEMP01106210.1.p1 GENE.GEMP01106210.1~~GEMP01106210.1.p1  ORF type:complete len:137 (+),score=36.30 GEMP01106210.1:30-440(+)
MVTRNRVHGGLFNPIACGNLFTYGALCLRNAGASELHNYLRTDLPRVKEALIAERVEYMSYELHRLKAPRVAVVVQDFLVDALIEKLEEGRISSEEYVSLAKAAPVVWPLLVLTYLVVPAGIGVWLASGLAYKALV